MKHGSTVMTPKPRRNSLNGRQQIPFGRISSPGSLECQNDVGSFHWYPMPDPSWVCPTRDKLIKLKGHQAYCKGVLAHLREKIWKKRPNFSKNEGWFLHHLQPTLLSQFESYWLKKKTFIFCHILPIHRIWQRVTFSCSPRLNFPWKKRICRHYKHQGICNNAAEESRTFSTASRSCRSFWIRA